MARLNFYINRAGSNLSADRIRVLKQAKEKLRKEMGEEQYEKKYGCSN